MYLRLVQFSLGAGRRSADKVIPAIRARPGCVRAEFFVDDATGDHGFIVLWASKKAADDAHPVISPILATAVDAAGAKGAPNIRTLEVYEPKK
jgi:quinol monooxygenase YgiN